MSLYYEAGTLLSSDPGLSGSLKSKVFSSTHLKSSQTQVYALLVEAVKWSKVLSEIIENSQLLRLERKLSPSLALLLVYDLLLSKKGIAAPTSHPLRVAVTSHKARLMAELTKARLKRGFSSLSELRTDLDRGEISNGNSLSDQSHLAVADAFPSQQWPHPRWVRVNTLSSSLKEQLSTTFAGYENTRSVEELLIKSRNTKDGKFLHIDKHVESLVAFAPSEDLTKTAAYRKGLIILQDKASCFSAYLLGAPSPGMDCIDACAAPGNKTTHLATILQPHPPRVKPRIFACERDLQRAKTLQKMVVLARADDCVVVKAGQDFLKLSPIHPKWNNVGAILLDPSCSGSGIVGRDEELSVTLPNAEVGAEPKASKKRKTITPKVSGTDKHKNGDESQPVEEEKLKDTNTRVTALSHLQLKLLQHAFSFPRATRIVYSTCSVYQEENEHVVVRALLSKAAVERGWRILRRREQISGLAAWGIRGQQTACEEALQAHGALAENLSPKEVAAACIRCEKGTEEGTQGFFVAGFVRPEGEASSSSALHSAPSTAESAEASDADDDYEWDREWHGFSDSDIS